jgi:hypothetical protein
MVTFSFFQAPCAHFLPMTLFSPLLCGHLTFLSSLLIPELGLYRPSYRVFYGFPCLSLAVPSVLPQHPNCCYHITTNFSCLACLIISPALVLASLPNAWSLSGDLVLLRVPYDKQCLIGNLYLAYSVLISLEPSMAQFYLLSQVLFALVILKFLLILPSSLIPRLFDF